MFRSTFSQSTRFVRTPLRAPQAPLRFAAIRPLTTSRPSFHPSSDKPNPHVDPQHLTLKAKDEAKALARDLAGMIGGGQHHARKVAEEAAAGARENVHAQGSVEQDFISTTKFFARDIPRHVLVFGLAGTLPYLATSVSTVVLAREASLAASQLPNISGLDFTSAMSALHTVEAVQITYGAIILSFLGALHWGMEFAKYGGQVGYERLIVGVVPVLVAWPTTFLSHGIALAVQWAGFTGTWMLDQRANTRGWTPHWYATYRFYLSIIVGFSIIGTLAATGYYGVGSGALAGPNEKDVTTAKLTSMQRLDQVAAKNHRKVSGVKTGHVAGEIETESMGEDGDAYVKFTNKTKTEEEAEEEEQEHEEVASKQDTKEIDQAATTPEGFKSEIKGRTDVRDGTQDKEASAGRADTESGKEGR